LPSARARTSRRSGRGLSGRMSPSSRRWRPSRSLGVRDEAGCRIFRPLWNELSQRTGGRPEARGPKSKSGCATMARPTPTRHIDREGGLAFAAADRVSPPRGGRGHRQCSDSEKGLGVWLMLGLMAGIMSTRTRPVDDIFREAANGHVVPCRLTRRGMGIERDARDTPSGAPGTAWSP
jgi:hypothetical protein